MSKNNNYLTKNQYKPTNRIIHISNYMDCDGEKLTNKIKKQTHKPGSDDLFHKDPSPPFQPP